MNSKQLSHRNPNIFLKNASEHAQHKGGTLVAVNVRLLVISDGFRLKQKLLVTTTEEHI